MCRGPGYVHSGACVMSPRGAYAVQLRSVDRRYCCHLTIGALKRGAAHALAPWHSRRTAHRRCTRIHGCRFRLIGRLAQRREHVGRDRLRDLP